MLSHTLRRLAGGGAAAALLALSPLALVAPAQAAPPQDCPAYAVSATTETSVSVSPSDLSPGQTFTATATVTSDGVPVMGGEVVFKYANRSKTDTVDGGEASATFAAKRGRIQVFASYSGQCLADSAAVGTSRGSAAVVAGVEASAGGGAGAGGGGNVGGAGGAGGGSGALPATGFDGETELLGLLGLGLVGVGAITLVARRRSHS